MELFHTHVCGGTSESRRGVSGPLELEIQAVVSSPNVTARNWTRGPQEE